MAIGKWISSLKGLFDVDALMNLDIKKAQDEWQWIKE